MENYARNFDRSSGAVCKTALDFMLNECLTIMVSLLDSPSTLVITLPRAQLFTYLACLRQSRIHRCRTDTSVYGVASDGYLFDFMMITHDGNIKISRRFDASSGDILKVLGCMRHILERSASTNPNSTQHKGEVAGDYADYAMDIDDNQYAKQAPKDEDDTL
jgi:hypothetical protein